MKKVFCDYCEVEITENNKVSEHSGLTAVIKKLGKPNLNIQVMEGDGSVPKDEKPDFCKYCVIDAVKSLDNRPREDANKQ